MTTVKNDTRAPAPARTIGPLSALLPFLRPPAWTYLDDRLDPASSTAIRARGLWPVGPA